MPTKTGRRLIACGLTPPECGIHGVMLVSSPQASHEPNIQIKLPINRKSETVSQCIKPPPTRFAQEAAVELIFLTGTSERKGSSTP